jgi:predicted nucleic acid-binding protein
MKTAFVDTSFYVALVNSRDALHGRAVQLAGSYQGELVTTDYVLIEARHGTV